MEIILLERVEKLGQMGDQVNVKPGYARNFLLPQGKALRANAQNRAYFEERRSHLEARNLERRSEAEKVGDNLQGRTFSIIRSAGETGQLYGSVAARDIVTMLDEQGARISRQQVRLNRPIKAIGIHLVDIAIHPEVVIQISANVARSEEEAERQLRGQDMTSGAADDEDDDGPDNDGDVDEISAEDEAGSEEETGSGDTGSAEDGIDTETGTPAGNAGDNEPDATPGPQL